MDGYFFILTTIDLFVLGFMCLLTKLSESLNKKQKRGFFLAFALIAAISVLEVITIVVDSTPPGYRPACGQSAGTGVLGPGTEPEGTAPGRIIEQKRSLHKWMQRPFLIQFVVSFCDSPYSLRLRKPQRPKRCPALRRRGYRWESAHRGTAG